MRPLLHSAVLLLLVCIFSTTASALDTSRSAIRTRTGCTVVLTCAGNGTKTEWRRFGALTPLVENNNLTIGNAEIEFPELEFSFFITNVTVLVYPESEHLLLSCFIFGTPPSGTALTNNFRISVDPEIVAIEPEINNVDISGYKIGSQVTIGCPVQTCAEDVRVQFFKGDEEIGSPEDIHLDTASSVYNLVLTVTEDIVGNYACKVDTTNPSDSDIVEFEVTGTPLPTLTPPPHTTTATTPSVPSNRTTTQTPTRDNHDGSGLLSPSVKLTLLTLLLGFSVLPTL